MVGFERPVRDDFQGINGYARSAIGYGDDTLGSLC